MFAVAAIYGFWALRGLTKERAEEVAEEEVRKIAPPLIRRIAIETYGTFDETDTISEPEVDKIINALDGKEVSDGK